MWQTVKTKSKALWTRFKAWAYGILLSLGLVAGVIAATVNFTYTVPTQYTDGTPLPLEQIEKTSLYCNGALVDEELGSDGDFSVILAPGTYECFATVTTTNGLESGPSNTVQKLVLPDVAPNPPVLN